MRLLLLALLACCWGVMPAWAVNDFQRSPWLIDSTGATPITAGLDIESLRWIGVATTGDTLILTDTTGRKVFQTVAPAGATEYELSLPIGVHKGLVINRIDSGVLYLYFK